MTKQPKIGDIVCYDENRKIRFIALDTFQGGTFPTAWETVGVVVIRKGNQVKVCSKENKTCRQMEVYPYIVSGYELDGAEHTATMKLHGSDTLDFKYTATTDAEFLEDLKSFLVDNGFTDWSAYIMDGQVILQYDNYTSPEYIYTSITQVTGLTLTAKATIDFPEVQPKFRMKCGYNSYGIWHVGQAKVSFAADMQLSGYNPPTDLTSMPAYPVCWPAFAGISQYQEDHCLWLRQKYCKDPAHPTKDEWEAYIGSLTHVIPYMVNGNAPEWRDGSRLSAMVKDIVYRAADGTLKKLYSAVNYCTEFMGGQGYMPSMTELIEAFGNITYGLPGVTREDSDPINRSLYVIAGTSVRSSAGLKSSGRLGDHLSPVAYANGAVDSGDFSYSRYPVVPFATIELPQAD